MKRKKASGKKKQREKYYERRLRDIADPSKFRAVKMDGAKSVTDTADAFYERVVGRRAARAEASA